MEKMRLKQIRKLSGYTSKQLGDLLGVNQTTISSWENGKFEPDIDTLKKISNLFDVSIDYLLCRTDIPNYEYKIATNGLKSKLSDEDIKEIILIVNEILASKHTDK